MILHDKISVKLPAWRERVSKLLKDHGNKVIDEVTIGQVYGGMRDITSMVTDISYVDPQEGIRFRGYSIPEILQKLPRPKDMLFPPAGGLYYLLLVGDIPTIDEAMEVEGEWKKRAVLPDYVYAVLKAMPPEAHPMTLFSQAILALQKESIFAKQYAQGLKKIDYWIPTLEDSINLTAKVPTIAAEIYNIKYRNCSKIKSLQNLDWSANFAHMIGKGEDRDYQELCRLYFILHSDHESGNVSAHTTHLVASALSDIYYACSAGMDGLAGPLHGLANQECLIWLLDVQKSFGKLPSRSELEAFTWETLKSGKVIPGYGHAVLRKPDPRFIAQMEFGNKYMPDDELFRLVVLVFEVIPEILSQLGKVKNPWPNVDAISGALQYYYGIREFDFYTVMFGISRILGVTANAVWARALNQPIERPKSLTTPMLEELANS